MKIQTCSGFVDATNIDDADTETRATDSFYLITH